MIKCLIVEEESAANTDFNHQAFFHGETRYGNSGVLLLRFVLFVYGSYYSILYVVRQSFFCGFTEKTFYIPLHCTIMELMKRRNLPGKMPERSGVFFMLGTNTARKISNYLDGGEYASYLYGGIKGNIAYCLKRNNDMYHTYYRASGIVKSKFAGVVDCYTSVNTFTKNSRKTEDVKRLCNLYVDLDVYKSEYRDTPKELIVEELKDNYFGRLLPWPTAIIDSGGGMYLIWHLQNEDRKALPRYLATEKYIVDTLSAFGADKACTDASRVLRVPGTINGKNGNTVRVMEFTDVAYTLHSIMREYEIGKYNRVHTSRKTAKHPYGTATEKMRMAAQKISTRTGLALPDFESYQDTFDYIAANYFPHREEPFHKMPKGKVISFADVRAKNYYLKQYVADIETLLTARKGADCKREYGLFLYRLFLHELTNDADFALEKTLALNSALSCPFSESYVKIRTASAKTKIEKGETYHYKRETIIAALEISAEEMDTLDLAVLTVARSPKEKKARANKKAYQKKLAEQGKETKKSTIAQRREKIAELRGKGLTAEAIMETLNISKATYYRDIAAMGLNACVDVCTHVIEEAVETITESIENAVEKAVGGVEGTVATVKSRMSNGRFVMPAQTRKNSAPAQSQKFSPTIIAGRRSRPARPPVQFEPAPAQQEKPGEADPLPLHGNFDRE